MKEVLTKKFWEDVKTTFEEARDAEPAKAVEPEVRPEAAPKDTAPKDTAPSPDPEPEEPHSAKG